MIQRNQQEAALYIAGAWNTGEGAPIRVINPANEEILAVAPGASCEQLSRAVAAARDAFDSGEWSRLTPRDRSGLLHRLADLMEENTQLLADLMVTEIATPVTMANRMQVPYAVANLRWFGDAALSIDRYFEEGLPRASTFPGQVSEVIREPIGPVAALTAFNFPLNLAAWKMGGAYASGCPVVLMCSPKAILTTTAFAHLVEEAGFPAGAFNLVYGQPDIAEALCSDPRIDMITFTGSAAVGSRIVELSARGLKRVVLELGGKSADIILPATNVESVAPAAVMGWAIDAGQVCSALTRTFVPRDTYATYIEAASDVVREIGCGDPTDESTVVGPVISGEQRSRIAGYVERAASAGGIIEVGGTVPSQLPKGFYYEPTIVSGVSNDSEIATEELFGPVSVVIPYDSVDEAVQMANASVYGLAANVWGTTPEALETGRRLRAGTVTINGGGGGMRCDHPWGGYKQSGLGREGGILGLREFFEIKHLLWPVQEPDAVRT